MDKSFEFKKEMTLSVKWLGIGQVFNYALFFIIWATLARLLPPDNFGALSIALAFSNLTVVFNELGMSAAIIQKKELTYSHVVTSFWVSVAAGVFFSVLGLSIADYVAAFFNNPAITFLISVFALKLLVDSFGIIQETLLMRELSFRKLMVIEVISGILFGIVAIGLAYKGLGIPAMGWGYLAKSVVKVILLGINCDFKPSLTFDKDSFNELFIFGKNIVGFKFFSYLTHNIDIILIGKFLGSTSLGYYSLAMTLVNFPRQKLSSIVSQVAFPAFSRMQDHVGEIRHAYSKLIRYASIVNFPLLIGLMLSAPYFVQVAYSAKWMEMVLPLKILCIYGASFSITTFVGIIFNSTGLPQYSFRFSLLNLFGVAAAVLTGLSYGLAGVAVSLSIYAVIVNVLGNLITGNILKISFFSYLREVAPAVMSTIIMAAVLSVLIIFQERSFLLPDAWFLMLMVFGGFVIYGSTIFLADRRTFLEMKSIVHSMFQKEC